MGLLKSAFDKIAKIKTITSIATGASDVIAVEHEGGEFLSTAFFLKFSTEDLENLENNRVRLLINGDPVNISIQVQSTGYVLFETQMDETVDQNFIINKLLENDGLKNGSAEDLKEEQLSEANLLKINMEELKKVRIENFRNRIFSKNLFSSFDFYNKKYENYQTMRDFLFSTKNIEFLLKKSASIYNYANLQMDDQKKDCNFYDTTFSGCNRMEIYFSDCLNQQLNGQSVRKIFHNNIIPVVDNVDNLAILLIGCRLCKDILIIPFTLYSTVVQMIFLHKKRKIKNRKIRVVEFFKKKLANLRNEPYKPKDTHTSQYLSSSDLHNFNLHDGINHAEFILHNGKKLNINIFKYNSTDRLIISDFDGTITKSDILGHVYTYMGKDYTHCDIAELFSGIEKNGYKFMYLSSRPITFYESTKKYLANIMQNGYTMPIGAVFLGNYGIFSVLFTEVVMRRPHLMKIAVLLEIKRVFKGNPFYGGFGNKKTDEISYLTADIPPSLIYIVSSSGTINNEVNKMRMRRYKSIQYFIDALFPKYKSDELNHEYNVNYSNNIYWR